MTSRQLDEEAVFLIARKLSDPEDRDKYLDQICAGDSALRNRVELLLALHEKESEPPKPPPDPGPTLEQMPLSEVPGQQIGRYKLLQKIGEGGFGVVYLAEQQRPVHRNVALKIIKPGMDTHAVIARFDAERQALALMEHPNISRVLDGGATESGRPYFVMELMKGVPITEYCDANNFLTQDRLNLFMTVCHAVQHAHQKGIIHRDIKPSNVLVTLHDGQPVVKVIDFGVAKAINQRLTEHTLFTAYGQMVGTPQYMSPEQAALSGLDVDTRSDVYSLGVLLYELVTGTTPLEGQRLRSAGYAEMQRMIREEEPLKPSTRLRTAGDNLTIIAKHRGVSPEKLCRVIRGDLDWIVMKGLEKDRTRRYESAGSFAHDVRRFLLDEPVEARPPSTWYRLRKYAARNSGAVSAVVAVGVSLLLGGLVAFVLAIQLKERVRQLEEQKQELIAAHEQRMDQLLEFAFDSAMRGDPVRTDQLVKRAHIDGSDPERARVVRALVSLYAGNSQAAIVRLTGNAQSECASVCGRAALARAYMHAGELERLKEVSGLLKATPVNDYDRLLMGHALAYYEPKLAVLCLEEVVSRRGSWALAHAMLAEALAVRALDTDDMELAKRSVDHAAASHRSLADHPYAISMSLFANHVALRLGRRRELDTSAWEAAAASAASELGRFRGFAFGAVLRAAYCEYLDDIETAESLWRAAAEDGRGGLWRLYLQALLFKLDRSKEALELGQGALCPLLFTVLSEGREQALSVYFQVVTDP